MRNAVGVKNAMCQKWPLPGERRAIEVPSWKFLPWLAGCIAAMNG